MHAKWITSGKKNDRCNQLPPELFRKTFTIEKLPQTAALLVSALGIYEARLNGVRVGEDFFTPGYTHYPSYVQQQRYDVTALLHSGENTLDILAANGWYLGRLGAAIVVALQSLIWAPFAGGFESTILGMGFVDVQGVVPSPEVQRFFTIAFYCFDMVYALFCVIILPFVDVEKHLPAMNAELERRQREAMEARGEIWVSPEEQERMEREQELAEAEKSRIEDLREKCAKKGLDFETENHKYLAKKADYEAKKLAKEEKKRAKARK